MAKNFPYFKFMATEWLTGDIVYEDYELQGIFINVCAIYWHRNADVTFEEIQKRLKTDRLNSLCPRFISVNDGKISIAFLDEQLHAANHISKVNSDNGKRGGRPKNKGPKPTSKRPLSETKAKKSKEEEELKKEYNNRKIAFAKSLEPFLDIYGKEMIRKFYDYWTEDNKSGTKFKMELEDTWDTEKRLKRWADNNKQFTKQSDDGVKYF